MSVVRVFGTDGPLIDDLDHFDLADYEHSLERLRALPVDTIHAGHDPSFWRDRLHELIDLQFRIWEAKT